MEKQEINRMAQKAGHNFFKNIDKTHSKYERQPYIRGITVLILSVIAIIYIHPIAIFGAWALCLMIFSIQDWLDSKRKINLLED